MEGCEEIFGLVVEIRSRKGENVGKNGCVV